MTDLGQHFGSELRCAREQAGLTLSHIADATKLSTRNLALLEANRIDQLPGGIYRRAIVRTYAASVGLDPEKTLRAFLALYPDDVPTWADLMPSQTAPKARSAFRMLFSAMSALVTTLAGVVSLSSSAR
jgi:cytoskeletal protein RodZ